MSLTENVSLESVHKRLDTAKISHINKDYIRQHDLNLSAKGVKPARRKRYLDILRWWALQLKKDFKKVSKKDLIQIIDAFNSDKILKKDGKPFAYATKELHKALLKTFYKWLEGKDKLYPEKVEWIRPDVISTSTKLPEDILTEDDVQRLIRASSNTRDQALISVLYESGCRASEFLGMKVKDLTHVREGVRIVVEGKTNRKTKQKNKRSILLISSIPYLSPYLRTHPELDNPDAPLWFATKRDGIRSLSYEGFKWKLKEIAKKAGVKKRIHPHIFRHSRETELAKVLTPSQLAVHFGHEQGSKMINKYVHLSGRDNDQALLKYYGLAKNEEELSRMRPEKCQICSAVNPKDADFCSNCGRGISAKAMTEAEELKKKEVIKIFEEYLQKRAPNDLLKKVH